jgi:small subunit ribosomal protein S16
MAVKIRLTRTGKKKQPSYRVVVMDSRKPRDGKYIEQIGRYDARQDPSLIEIDNERALHWLKQGAQPTERAQKLLEISGAWAQYRVDRGEIHTVGEHKPPEWAERAASDQPQAASEEAVEDIADSVEEAVEATIEAADASGEVVEAVEEAADEATSEAPAEDAEGIATPDTDDAEASDDTEKPEDE